MTGDRAGSQPQGGGAAAGAGRRPPASRLARGPEEDEADHLLRVASELGGANRPLLAELTEQLESPDRPAQFAAAERLGALGDRESVAVLRELLVSDDPLRWEVAVHGLRRSAEREGWLCLESVALDSLDALADPEPRTHQLAALRLLAMGRTKTMDRLFRAVDGHSRSIPRAAAEHFVRVAIGSLPAGPARVLALRLGMPEEAWSNAGRGAAAERRRSDALWHGQTIAEVARATGLTEEAVRALEAEAWRLVQTPRPWRELGAN